jgi:phosphate transport system substrate-binding protein
VTTTLRGRLGLLLAVFALSGALAACGGADAGTDDSDTSGSSAGAGSEELSGTIQIDGSSTVAPLSEAAAELFQAENPDVRVVVGTSGTGGGFEKFCAGETDISDASRPIEEDEVAVCEENGITYEEITVANDGLAVVVNPENPIECITVEQLNKIWAPDSKVANFSEVDPSFPDQEMKLFGPGTDSGTFDFFTEVINGEGGASREDYEASEDDNQLVTGVSGTEGALGYFGFSYYEQNVDKLGLVQVDGGDGCVPPSVEAIQDGSYKPLGRPIFMYPSAKGLQKPEVRAFMEFVVTQYQPIAEAAQIVPLTDEQAAEAKSKVDALAGGA